MNTRQMVIRGGLLAMGTTAILLTAACGGGQAATPAPGGAAGATDTTGSTATTYVTPSAGASTTTIAPPAGTSTALANASATVAGGPIATKTRECRSADLRLALGGSDGTAGTTYVALNFTNKSSTPCVMVAFPGVSYVAPGNGKQVGAAAQRDGSVGPQVTLKPGGVASAIVGMTDHGVFDAKVCRPTPVAGFRVYPPDETASMYLALPNGGTGCAGETPSPQLRVTAIKAGPGQP